VEFYSSKAQKVKLHELQMPEIHKHNR